MLYLRYFILFILMSILYIMVCFYSFRNDYWLLLVFLMLVITPYIGRMVLRSEKKTRDFYISYIVLVIAMIPTWGDVSGATDYPYNIVAWVGIELGRDGIFLSYIFPWMIVPVIYLIITLRAVWEEQ